MVTVNGMAIWELRCASVNDYAPIIPLDQHDVEEHRFDVDGTPMDWMDRPLVGFAVDTRRKQQRPRADVSLMLFGSLVLNERAYQALGPFLSKFGQLLELDCEGGELRYFYNVTNIVACVDTERSEKFRSGAIKSEVFDESRVPREAAVFKDPSTAMVRIYVNEAGKQLIDQLAGSAGLTGIECAAPRPM